MASQENILNVYNKENPKVKLTYELFDFPLNEEIKMPRNKGMLIAFYNLSGNKTILNSVYQKGAGLELIELNLIAKVQKLVNPENK